MKPRNKLIGILTAIALPLTSMMIGCESHQPIDHKKYLQLVKKMERGEPIPLEQRQSSEYRAARENIKGARFINNILFGALGAGAFNSEDYSFQQNAALQGIGQGALHNSMNESIEDSGQIVVNVPKDNQGLRYINFINLDNLNHVQLVGWNESNCQNYLKNQKNFPEKGYLIQHISGNDIVNQIHFTKKQDLEKIIK